MYSYFIMPRRLHRRMTRKTKQKHKNKSRRRGGNGEKAKCCVCENMVNKQNTFIPRQCLISHGQKAAHRICANCWWDSETGFAKEDTSHKCPGCVKNLPLTQYKKEAPIIVDLTDD